VAKLYWLNWDEEAKERANNPDIDEHPAMGPAGELKHKLDVVSVLDEDEKPPEQFQYNEFQDLYREVTELDGDYTEEDLEQVWAEWNAGSRKESQEFYDAEVRSMTVGDVVEVDGSYYQAKSVGFDEIAVEGGENHQS